MTEEIIIDGVDVAKCEFYIDDYKYSCDLSFINQAEPCNCENINTCYYKHWQRLKQENRELKAYKDVNEDFKKAWDELNKKYTEVLKLAKENADSNEYCLQELEQENKELKEMLSKEPKAMQAFQISYSGLKRDNETLWGMVKDYKTALEEIQRVINLAYKTGDYLLGQDYTDLVDTIEKELEVLND